MFIDYRYWAARYNTWLLIKLMPKGVIFSYIFLTTDGQAGPKPAAWWSHVVELRMADQGLRRIQGLDQLTALRKACFAHNEISYIQGLEACTALQELSFEVSIFMSWKTLSLLLSLL